MAECFQLFSLGNRKREEAQKEFALQRFGRDLTELAAKGGAFDRSAGGDAENHPDPAAKPGVGKTGIVEGFAQLLAEGKLPETLGRAVVIEIFLTSLVGRAGAVPLARLWSFALTGQVRRS